MYWTWFDGATQLYNNVANSWNAKNPEKTWRPTVTPQNIFVKNNKWKRRVVDCHLWHRKSNCERIYSYPRARRTDYSLLMFEYAVATRILRVTVGHGMNFADSLAASGLTAWVSRTWKLVLKSQIFLFSRQIAMHTQWNASIHGFWKLLESGKLQGALASLMLKMKMHKADEEWRRDQQILISQSLAKKVFSMVPWTQQ